MLRVLNEEQVDYLLIGGMNFLIRHLPELTFDVDIWAGDEEENLRRLNRALRRLGAQWGRTETEWRPVPEDPRWLQLQPVFCLTTDHGALDIFREVRGLEGRFEECKARRVRTETARRDSGAFDVAVSTDARNNSTRVFIDSYGRAGQFGYGPSIELTGSEALTLFRALKRHYESTGKDSALYT